MEQKHAEDAKCDDTNLDHKAPASSPSLDSFAKSMSWSASVRILFLFARFFLVCAICRICAEVASIRFRRCFHSCYCHEKPLFKKYDSAQCGKFVTAL